MSPPDIFVTPPSPTSSSSAGSEAFYLLPQASTSDVRITCPMILVPDYKEPLSTTLTTEQLVELLPILHIFINPCHPSIAVLPAGSVSYTGLKSALRWREAEFQRPDDEIVSTLPDIIQIYQALAFLGQNPRGTTLKALSKMIEYEIDEGLSLTEYEEVWALRNLPFTEPFIKTIVTRVAQVSMKLDDAYEKPEFYDQLDADEELQCRVEATLDVFRWVHENEELDRRVRMMRQKLEREETRKRQRKVYRRNGRRETFQMRLETVPEGE